MSRKCKWFWAVSLFIPFTAILAILLLHFVPDPGQETTGAIRVSPIVPRVLFDDADSSRPMPNYDNFKRTEAARMASDIVLNKVADKLKGLNLKFFQGSTDPVLILRQGVKNRNIVFDSDPQTELILIRMTSRRPTDAEKIINAFLDSYIEVYNTEETKGGGQTMTILEDQRQRLLTKMDQQRNMVVELIEEFGTQKVDTTTIHPDRKQFAIQDQQEQLERTKELYNAVCARIEEIKVESQRPARISIAFRAGSIPIDRPHRPRMIVLVAIDVVLLIVLVRILMSGIQRPSPTISGIPRPEGDRLQDDLR